MRVKNVGGIQTHELQLAASLMSLYQQQYFSYLYSFYAFWLHFWPSIKRANIILVEVKEAPISYRWEHCSQLKPFVQSFIWDKCSCKVFMLGATLDSFKIFEDGCCQIVLYLSFCCYLFWKIVKLWTFLRHPFRSSFDRETPRSRWTCLLDEQDDLQVGFSKGTGTAAFQLFQNGWVGLHSRPGFEACGNL